MSKSFEDVQKEYNLKKRNAQRIICAATGKAISEYTDMELLATLVRFQTDAMQTSTMIVLAYKLEMEPDPVDMRTMSELIPVIAVLTEAMIKRKLDKIAPRPKADANTIATIIKAVIEEGNGFPDALKEMSKEDMREMLDSVTGSINIPEEVKDRAADILHSFSRNGVMSGDIDFDELDKI